jgi:hypothetical protein
MTDQYEGVKITKLPPGEAYGARDLTNWAVKRTSLGFSSKDNKREKKRTQRLANAAGHPIRSFTGKLIRPTRRRDKS